MTLPSLRPPSLIAVGPRGGLHSEPRPPRPRQPAGRRQQPVAPAGQPHGRDGAIGPRARSWSLHSHRCVRGSAEFGCAALAPVGCARCDGALLGSCPGLCRRVCLQRRPVDFGGIALQHSVAAAYPITLHGDSTTLQGRRDLAARSARRRVGWCRCTSVPCCRPYTQAPRTRPCGRRHSEHYNALPAAHGFTALVRASAAASCPTLRSPQRATLHRLPSPRSRITPPAQRPATPTQLTPAWRCSTAPAIQAPGRAAAAPRGPGGLPLPRPGQVPPVGRQAGGAALPQRGSA
jgi:hypothetical protein